MSRQEAIETQWKRFAEENRIKRIHDFAEFVANGAMKHHLTRSRDPQPISSSDLACIVAAALQLWVETQS